MSEDTKKAPDIRFQGFTDDWEQRTLGELSEIVRGASPRPIQDPKWFDSNSDVGWLRISDVTAQNGRIYYLEQKISKVGQEKTRVLTEPHLLLSIAATVGKPVVNYVNTGVHDGFLIFLNPLFDREYMFQWLEMFRPKWQKYGQPGSQVNLNSELVRNQEIMIPSLKEQIQIGTFFKKLDDTIALHLCKQRKLNQLKQSLIREILPQSDSFLPHLRLANFRDPWKKHQLKEVLKVNSGRDYKHLDKGNIPVYGTGGYMLSVDGKLSDIDGIGLGRKGTIDKPQYLKAPFWTVDTLFYLTPFPNYDIYFLYTLIQSINWKSMDESTGVPSLSKSVIERVTLTFPVLEEQQKIGSVFKQLDDTIILHQEKVAHLKTLKNTLLSKMFI